MIRIRQNNKVVVAAFLKIAILSGFLTATAQSANPQDEIGVVYYRDANGFRPLNKDRAPQGGRPDYAARVPGLHAAVRLRSDQPQLFRVCGVDPTRFKLFRFRTEGNKRVLVIDKINMWTGGTKTVVSDSEVQVAIQKTEDGCFTITPRNPLPDGEYGFSPLESFDAFMFGVGEVQGSH